MTRCRICGGNVREFFDFGRQPVSDTFLDADGTDTEFFYRLSVGHCTDCSMTQQLTEVPRDRMFPADYPYRSSGSAVMRDHFAATAEEFLGGELAGGDPLYVEIGCNDGILLGALGRAGVRHLGVDPAAQAAEVARSQGCRVRTGFFEESAGREIREAEGPARLIFSANTVSHIAYIESVFAGADALLAPGGVFVFEDRYLGDIIDGAYFDQVYDEHFYLFSVRSVRNMARRFGFELVDIAALPVHGGAMRYTTARAGERTPTAAVAELLAAEDERGLAEPDTYGAFGARVEANCRDLVKLLTSLRNDGRRVVGYGATSKSATVTNYCGIGTDLIPFICDSTREKQGRLTPGSRIPIRPPAAFADPYPDYALLFAWNHAEEIMAKERAFREAGGRWILYVPGVHVV